MKASKIYGPGTFNQLAQGIEQDGARLSPMGETVSLVHPAYKGFLSFLPFGRKRQIRSVMKNNFIYAFTDIHYFPCDLVFYHDFNRLDDRFKNPTKKQLEEMLGSREEKGVVFSDDGMLRRVEGRHKAGKLKKGELSSHPNIIGQTGSLESAYELDEIAGVHKENPYLGLLQNVEHPETRVSALNSSWYLGRVLNVGGYNRGDDRNSYAFGVFDAQKARAEN